MKRVKSVILLLILLGFIVVSCNTRRGHRCSEPYNMKPVEKHQVRV